MLALKMHWGDALELIALEYAKKKQQEEQAHKDRLELLDKEYGMIIKTAAASTAAISADDPAWWLQHIPKATQQVTYQHAYDDYVRCCVNGQATTPDAQIMNIKSWGSRINAVPILEIFQKRVDREAKEGKLHKVKKQDSLLDFQASDVAGPGPESDQSLAKQLEEEK